MPTFGTTRNPPMARPVRALLLMAKLPSSRLPDTVAKFAPPLMPPPIAGDCAWLVPTANNARITHIPARMRTFIEYSHWSRRDEWNPIGTAGFAAQERPAACDDCRG